MPEILQKMADYLQGDFPRYLTLIGQHLYIDAISILVCCAIAIPLGYLCARNARASKLFLAIASVIMVIPSLAMFALLQPITGIGVVPAIIALSTMSVPLLLINTRSGFMGIDPTYLESARGMGMERWRVFRDVELPLASPAILNGLRITVVSIIASTTIAAYVNAGGLGFYIVLGFQSNRPEIMYIGALSVAVIAVAADAILAKVQRHRLAKVS